MNEMTEALAVPQGFSPFQVLIRLQYLRFQIRNWIWNGDIEEVLRTLRGLADAARTNGVNAYAALCLHLAELIEPLIRSGDLPGTTRCLLEGWADHSDRYLRHPGNPSHAALLIAQLNRPEWASPFSRAEQEVLLRALREPFALNTSPSYA